MKKILAIAMLIVGTAAMAHGPVGRPHSHWHPSYGWVFPTIIGGVVGYEIARQQQPVIVQQPPVVVQQPPVVVQQPPVTCTAWREIQQPDGVIIRERICTQ